MENSVGWIPTEKEKKKFIDALTPELSMLRKRAGISQEDLAALIGVSRQTYGAVERKSKRMSWGTYLSLIMFFDYNQKTHQLIRTIGAFPYDIIKHFNDNHDVNGVDDITVFGDGIESVYEHLDEQALHSIKTVIMLEYARCTNTPGDVVVKSFDGKVFNFDRKDYTDATKALKKIKERKKKNDNP